MIIRSGQESDRQAIYDLMAQYEMQAELDPGEFVVALEGDELVGAARLEWYDGRPYLRPVVVQEGWHSRGVGKTLLQTLIVDLPELLATARGEALGFYRAMGFTPTEWDDFPPKLRQECAACPDLKYCRPQPVRWQPTVGDQ